MSTQSEQEELTAHARQIRARDKRIAELETTVARHERANGRLAAELQAAVESRDANARLYHEHQQEVLRLEALVERHGLNAAPGAVNPDVADARCVVGAKVKGRPIGTMREVSGEVVETDTGDRTLLVRDDAGEWWLDLDSAVLDRG